MDAYQEVQEYHKQLLQLADSSADVLDANELVTPEQVFCTPVRLPAGEMQRHAANVAIEHNPINRPPVERLLELLGDNPQAEQVLHPDYLAVLATKYWRGGAVLSVAFMDGASNQLANLIIKYANLWNAKGSGVKFVLSTTDPQIRIYRGQGGYWSYLGTDNLTIARNRQTMNLEGFTLKTPESEYLRVVCHEFGHALGFPHEHMRGEIIQRLNPVAVYEYFRRTQGWSEAETRQQVLVPIEEKSLLGTSSVADQSSIMAYQLPASLTIDGKPIIGGKVINDTDYIVCGKTYPGEVKPPVVEPPVKPPVQPPTGLPDTFTGAATIYGRLYKLIFSKVA